MSTAQQTFNSYNLESCNMHQEITQISKRKCKLVFGYIHENNIQTPACIIELCILFAFKFEIIKKKTPQQMRREWTRSMKKEMRAIARRIRKSQAQKKKMQAEIKKKAKNVNGDKQRLAAIRIMAKSIVQIDQQIAHLYGTKAQINGVCLHIKEQEATLKMTKSIRYNPVVSQMMGKLVKLPELQGTMMKIQQEMQKNGLIQETWGIQDIWGTSVSDDDIDEEIDKVIMEITDMNLADIGAIDGKLPKQKEDINKMQARLANLQ